MKKGLLIIGLIGLSFLAGCSTNDKVSELEQQIETLQSENKSYKDAHTTRKNLLEQSAKKDLDTKESSDSPKDDDDLLIENDELKETESIVKQFIEAQYNYTNHSDRLESMKPFMTSAFLTLYESPAFETESNTEKIDTLSEVNLIDIYSVSVDGREGKAVAKVQNRFTVGDGMPIDNNMLLEFGLVKESDGEIKIDSQVTYSIELSQ